MAAFIRHVGQHGDRKVAIVFREVPGESHMCLVVYTELLNRNIHDPLISCIESDIGQNSENLADALNRMHTRDGKILLQVLHAEGMLKKVNTEQIVMTPAPNTKIKLNELNKILNEMKQGEEATKRLAEMDKSMGMQSPAEVARRMRGDIPAQQPVTAAQAGALGDDALANQFRMQAEKMQREAQGLMAEAQRLLNEAAQMSPAAPAVASVKKEKKPKQSKTKVVV